jgi:hypothetical protein
VLEARLLPVLTCVFYVPLELVCFPDYQESTIRSRNRSPNQDQVIFFINADHLQVTYGDLAITVLASHATPLEKPARAGTHTGTPGVAMDLLDAMGGSLARKVVPFHYAGKATPLAGGCYIDRNDFGEVCDCYLLADLVTFGVARELADKLLGLALCPGCKFDAGILSSPGSLAVELAADMTTFATSCLALASAGTTILGTLLVQETKLHGLVAVGFVIANLQDVAGTCFNDRDRHGLASIVKNLCHPDLPAEYPNRHRPVLVCWWEPGIAIVNGRFPLPTQRPDHVFVFGLNEPNLIWIVCPVSA